jgi:hypothetical protein
LTLSRAAPKISRPKFLPRAGQTQARRWFDRGVVWILTVFGFGFGFVVVLVLHLLFGLSGLVWSCILFYFILSPLLAVITPLPYIILVIIITGAGSASSFLPFPLFHSDCLSVSS